VLQCVAVCCSVLQCVAVCCSVLQCVAVCCSQSALAPNLGLGGVFFYGLLILGPGWWCIRELEYELEYEFKDGGA